MGEMLYGSLNLTTLPATVQIIIIDWMRKTGVLTSLFIRVRLLSVPNRSYQIIPYGSKMLMMVRMKEMTTRKIFKGEFLKTSMKHFSASLTSLEQTG
jgi:hypothetical protein